MPFPAIALPAPLITQLNAFIAANNIATLYMGYDWDADTYARGFPNILALENQLCAADQTGGIGLIDVNAIAAWGRLRNPRRINGPTIILPPNSLMLPTGAPQPALAADPLPPLIQIEGSINGIGPTYTTKVLRFGCPLEYGAIDTRCVRIFGQGDCAHQQHNWLPVTARNSGSGWYIPSTQANWPAGYVIWLNIIRYIAHNLNVAGLVCPHPQPFEIAGRRGGGVWTCADVEMALFAYASQFV